MLTLRPGSMETLNDFLRCYEKEQLCAAYNGYKDVIEFRKFCLSAPMIKAYVAYRKAHAYKPGGVQARRVLECFNPRNPDPAKKLHPAAGFNKNDWQVAKTLFDLSKVLSGPLKQSTIEETGRYLSDMGGPYHFEHFLPDLPPYTPVYPVLGPLRQETDLESYNRLFCILRYIQYVDTSKNYWDKRFATEQLKKVIKIPETQIPGWMRDRAHQPTRATLKEVQELDKRTPKQWTILWKKTENLDRDLELNDHVKTLMVDGKKLPSTEQPLTVDPRSAEAAAWRDSIKRQYRCKDLSLTISSLELSHKPKAKGENAIDLDLLDCPWDQAKSTFEKLPADEVSIHVLLSVLSEGEELFECRESSLLPEIDPHAPEILRGTPETHSDQTETVCLENPQKGKPDSKRKGKKPPKPEVPDAVKPFTESAALGQASLPKRALPEDNFPDGGSDECLEYYGGHDIVGNLEALRVYQEKLFRDLAGPPAPFRKQPFSVKSKEKEMSKDERDALEEALVAGRNAAMTREFVSCFRSPLQKYFDELTMNYQDDEVKAPKNPKNPENGMDETRYYEIQGAFEGTPQQVGPPVDLAATIMGMREESDGLYSSQLLGNFTTRHFYPYQVNGAAYMCMKSFGYIPIPAAHAKKATTKKAIQNLGSMLRTWGGFLKDQTGFGKTVTVLLMLAYHAKFRPVDNPKSTCILVPATLLRQWIEEITSNWLGLHLWLMYAGIEHGIVREAQIIKRSHLENLPDTKHLESKELKRLLNVSDTSAIKKSSIILSSYETFGERTTYTETIEYDENGEKKTYPVWRTRFQNISEIIILDEANKVKSRNSRAFASVSLPEFEVTWHVTATPMQNGESVSLFESTFEH